MKTKIKKAFFPEIGKNPYIHTFWVMVYTAAIGFTACYVWIEGTMFYKQLTF